MACISKQQLACEKRFDNVEKLLYAHSIILAIIALRVFGVGLPLSLFIGGGYGGLMYAVLNHIPLI